MLVYYNNTSLRTILLIHRDILILHIGLFAKKLETEFPHICSGEHALKLGLEEAMRMSAKPFRCYADQSIFTCFDCETRGEILSANGSRTMYLAWWGIDVVYGSSKASTQHKKWSPNSPVFVVARKGWDLMYCLSQCISIICHAPVGEIPTNVTIM